MTIQDSVNLDELRRLAEQATPGPWEWFDDILRRVDNMAEVVSGDAVEMGHGWAIVSKADAAYIAAASPDMILRLLDERDEYEAKLGHQIGVPCAAERRVAALEAALRELVGSLDAWWSDGSDLSMEMIGEAKDKARQLLSEEVSHE